MNLKNIWLIFIVPMVAIVPFKIYSHFAQIAFIESSAFMIISMVILAAIMACICFAKTGIRNLDLNQNIPLGISGILVGASFFWCITAYATDTARYDFEWQPIILSIMAVFSCIAFVLIALTFFMGKNMFRSASFFIYCPVIWFALAMVLFLSIYNNNPNIYEILLQSLIALFLIYHTQVFSTSSNGNIVKLLYLFGIPAIVTACIKSLPILIDAVRNQTISNQVTVATSALEFTLAIYIVLILIEAQVQSNKASKPGIKTNASA